MVEIVSVGHTGITNFTITRGTGDPLASFNVEYYPCNGFGSEQIKSGDIIHLLLSDPKHGKQYQDIFKGMIDTVTTIYSTEGEGYHIQGRDLAAVLAYQKYVLYDDLVTEKEGAKSSLGGGNSVNLWKYILEIMENTPLTTLKTSLGPGGEMQFSATEWWSYWTDAAEKAPNSMNIGRWYGHTPDADGMIEYQQGERHRNHKERFVVQRQEGTKVDALNSILNDAIGIGSHLGKYSWFVDKGGALVIFRIDKPEKTLSLRKDMTCIERIEVTDDSTGITNGCQGYGHILDEKTTEPPNTTRIECYVKDEGSIIRFGLREAGAVDNPDLSEDELRLTCKNSINPNPKYAVTVVMNNYSDISPATALRFPGINNIIGKTFTVTDYTITGNPGDYQTTFNGEIWDQAMINPTPYHSIQAIARIEAEKMFGVPANVIGVDTEAGMVKVIAANNKKPYWVRYLRK